MFCEERVNGDCNLISCSGWMRWKMLYTTYYPFLGPHSGWTSLHVKRSVDWYLVFWVVLDESRCSGKLFGFNYIRCAFEILIFLLEIPFLSRNDFTVFFTFGIAVFGLLRSFRKSWMYEWILRVPFPIVTFSHKKKKKKTEHPAAACGGRTAAARLVG